MNEKQELEQILSGMRAIYRHLKSKSAKARLARYANDLKKRINNELYEQGKAIFK